MTHPTQGKEMGAKGSKKPADDDSSLTNNGSKGHESASEDASTCADNGNGAGGHDIENNEFTLNEDVDWSLSGILNHPSGVDYALKQNLELMEQQTKALIENGSIEDLMKALEENNRQLEMLRDRMEGNLTWLTTLG